MPPIGIFHNIIVGHDCGFFLANAKICGLSAEFSDWG
jgi:hypothetical protein